MTPWFFGMWSLEDDLKKPFMSRWSFEDWKELPAVGAALKKGMDNAEDGTKLTWSSASKAIIAWLSCDEQPRSHTFLFIYDGRDKNGFHFLFPSFSENGGGNKKKQVQHNI